MSRPDRIPLKPDYAAAARGRTGTPLVRAAAASVEAYIRKTLAKDVVAHRWPRDTDTEAILRAAVSPATLTTSGWADSLAGTSIADFIANMGPASAGSQLLRRGIQFQFNGAAAISVPGLLSASGNSSFVQEGMPVPVRHFSIDSVTLLPRKFMTISTFAREVFEHSTPTIESLVRTALTESVGLTLDVALFDNSGGDDIRPAGLLYNIAALSASSTTPPSEALAEDIRELVGAVADVAANAPVVLVASPKQAVSLRLWFGSDVPYEVLSSSALAAGSVVAIATNAVASAIDPAPRFDVSSQAVLHMDDAPTQVSIEGTPDAIAAPLRSLYQTDSIGLRLRLELDWALRSAGAIAWMQSVRW